MQVTEEAGVTRMPDVFFFATRPPPETRLISGRSLLLCEMKCYVHPEVDAVGVCSECNKWICAACTVTIEGRSYCKHDLSRAFSRQRAPGIAQKPAFLTPPPEATPDQGESEEAPEAEEQVEDATSGPDPDDPQPSPDESSDST